MMEVRKNGARVWRCRIQPHKLLTAVLCVLVCGGMVWRFYVKESELNSKKAKLALPQRWKSNTKYFKQDATGNIFIYSAISNIHHPRNEHLDSENKPVYEVEIVLTAFDVTKANYVCCIISGASDSQVHVSPAQYYFQKDIIKPKPNVNLNTLRQYSCIYNKTTTNEMPSYATLSATTCPTDTTQYFAVRYPTKKPGHVALCAKIVHGNTLDPEKIIEWVEMQKILGVDKILVYNLGIPDHIFRVFRFYQFEGIIEIQPYELPGEPKDRTLSETFKRTPQFSHDETLAVVECRLRMAGYDYIISHDLDEMIVPRENISIKQFLQHQTTQHPEAASFFFHTEFFITTWEPTNPEEDLMIKRYRKTTVPRWECYKYVYLSSRVVTTVTHAVYVIPPYKNVRVPPDEAILHHYRQCPEDTWKTCTVPSTVDDVMTRYPGVDERVRVVRVDTKTEPRWKVVPKS